MGLLRLLSGAPVQEHAADTERYNKTLMGLLTERRLKGAMGAPGETLSQIPPSQEGPQLPPEMVGTRTPGSGLFSGDPQEQLMAQALMANINPSFASAFTATAGAPAAFRKATAVKTLEEEGQMARQLQKQEFGQEHPFKTGQTRTIQKGEGFSTKVETQEYQSDGTWKVLATGDKFRPATAGGGQYGFTSEDIDLIADKVFKGELAPSDLGKRGGIQVALAAAMEKKYPQFNMIDAEANSKYRRMSQNLQSIGAGTAVVPLFTGLRERALDLNNSNIPLWNKIKNATKEQLGQPEIVEFNQLRDDLVSESQRLMTGASVSSQARYDRAVENLQSSLNYKQLDASLSALEEVVNANIEARKGKPFDPAANTPKVEVATLPAGFVLQADGRTAIHPDGRIARMQ